MFVGFNASRYFQLLGLTLQQVVQPLIETTDIADESLMECDSVNGCHLDCDAVLLGVSHFECDTVTGCQSPGM
jgi:hypothetical protein